MCEQCLGVNIKHESGLPAAGAAVVDHGWLRVPHPVYFINCWADKQLPGNTNQLATKNESYLAAPRVGVMRITSACGSGEWIRSGGGALLSKVSWAGSTRGAEPLLTHRISARIEAS